jgi:hypothetical protein
MPGAAGTDVSANYWLRQVTLRLRREVCWLWRERGSLAGVEPGAALLPPFVDRAAASLDLARYDHDKRTFFASDPTASHLSALIDAPSEDDLRVFARGSFGWLARALALAPVEQFVLATALLPVVDSAAGSVIATCLNDATRTEPTLALVQRLWDDPADVLARFDSGHLLVRYGVLPMPAAGWDAPLSVPPPVARTLLFSGADLPSAMQAITSDLTREAPAVGAARVIAGRDGTRRVVPILGGAGTPLAELASACARAARRALVAPAPFTRREDLAPMLTTAWLRGDAVYLTDALLARRGHDEVVELPLPSLPVTIFIGARDRSELKHLADSALVPPIVVAPLGYAERLACWRRVVPAAATDAELAGVLAEVARRFRLEREAIERIGAEVAALGRRPELDDFLNACRGDIDLGSLAQEVIPRFTLGELMLPPAQTRQIDEIGAAMTNLTRVHYDWGTARAWNEGGLAALFAGPPGTGKTMAAEALASTLRLPLYRIDLSQVVNKYIGETEKNLRRLFDAADASDVMLFFDEADALFGKRTEVKDAHDRYANLEVSYLLERMERFKGLAILATNRKKDLDEAFLRRLRFVVDFPLPGVPERLRIWQSVIPAGVDASGLDLPFLAQRFALAGGHIRAVVFHACLQSAADGAARVLTMPAVIRAVRREFEKLDRAISLDQFGPYASLVTKEGPQ